jgi:hypothetical protein
MGRVEKLLKMFKQKAGSVDRTAVKESLWDILGPTWPEVRPTLPPPFALKRSLLYLYWELSLKRCFKFNPKCTT